MSDETTEVSATPPPVKGEPKRSTRRRVVKIVLAATAVLALACAAGLQVFQQSNPNSANASDSLVPNPSSVLAGTTVSPEEEQANLERLYEISRDRFFKCREAPSGRKVARADFIPMPNVVGMIEYSLLNHEYVIIPTDPNPKITLSSETRNVKKPEHRIQDIKWVLADGNVSFYNVYYQDAQTHIWHAATNIIDRSMIRLTPDTGSDRPIYMIVATDNTTCDGASSLLATRGLNWDDLVKTGDNMPA